MRDNYYDHLNAELSNWWISQSFYVQWGNCTKLLLTMCIRLQINSENWRLEDLALEPNASSKDKKLFKFNNWMLCNQVICCATFWYNKEKRVRVPQPSSWSFDVPKRLPRLKTADTIFLQSKVLILFESLQASAVVMIIPVSPIVNFHIANTVKSAYLKQHDA